jgi:hypothetical protein
VQHRALIACCALVVSGCVDHKRAEQPAQSAPAAKPAAATDKVTLLFMASTAGQLVPCGCSPDQRGGLPRMVHYVRSVRAAEPNVLFADAGDLLFESNQRPNDQLYTQKQLKARVLADQEALAGVSARAVGPRDLALGPRFVADTAGQATLLDAGVAPVPEARALALVDAGAVKVGLFAAGYEDDTAATIAARAKELKAQGARLVVMFALPHGSSTFAAAQAMLPAAKEAGVDLVVLGKLDDPASDANRKDNAGLLAVEGHGQSLLRVDVKLGTGPLQLAPSQEDKQGDLELLDSRIARFKQQIENYPDRKPQLQSKIDELQARRDALAKAPLEQPAPGSTWAQARFIPLDSKIPSAEDAQQLVNAYDDRIAALNLAEAKLQPESCAPPGRGEPAYVGVAACAACHESEAKFWSQTRHAHAYNTLVEVKKQFSLDCIRCHVTGWQQPGGVCRIDRTAIGSPAAFGHGMGRQDVQCEDCHGPGGLHADDPSVRMQSEVPAAWCMRCHEPANSPRFDDAKYRPYIIGPGHGEALAKGQDPKPRPGGPNKH